MKKSNIIKSSFFLKLFGIPYLFWTILTLFAMIPNETDPDPLTWTELIESNLVVLIIWFTISIAIVLITNKRKKHNSKPKNIKGLQCITKNDNKIEKISESKKEIKIQLNDKYLYKYETISSSEEYKKMAKYFPNRMYWVFIKRELLKNIIYSAIIEIVFNNIICTLIFFFMYQILAMIIYKVNLEYFAEQVWNKRNKNGLINNKVEIDFYNDYLITNIGDLLLTIKYSDISRCIETDTNFYLEYSKYNVVLIIKKNCCELELINFIREKIKNIENYLGDSQNFKSIKKYHHPKFIKNAMLFLFIITIASLWGALYSLEIVDKIIPRHGLNFTKNMWVFWCWLPIPILSIILGFKYKNAGFKCTKNIVGGFIISILLLLYGAFCMFPTPLQDYNKIDEYRNIIDAELPNNGELEIQNLETYFDEDKTEYTIINAYYDKENVTNLVNSIEKSNNWILSKKIKSNLKIIIPHTFYSADDVYYSIYNKTTNQYNTLPEIPGNYEIYAMKYDKSDKHLEIHKFKYRYQ